MHSLLYLCSCLVVILLSQVYSITYILHMFLIFPFLAGVLNCMTNAEQKLSEIHSKLMSQNISFHSQLTQPGEQVTPPKESHDSASSKQATPLQ